MPEDDLYIEWTSLRIDPICQKMADDLFKKTKKNKKFICQDAICITCGRIFVIKKIKILENFFPVKNKRLKIHFCNKCFKKVRFLTLP